MTMTNRQIASKSLLLGWLLAPLAGAATAIALCLLRDRLRPVLAEPWDDLLEMPFLFAQGAFVTAIGFLLMEWALVRRRGPQVKTMTAGDRTTWGGAARQAALTAYLPRPSRADRDRQLKQYRGHLAWVSNLRWLGYVALTVAPTAAGLVFGLRSVRLNPGLELGFTGFFTPLLVGVAEAVLLWVPGCWVRLRTVRLLDDWYERVKKLEDQPPLEPAREQPADDAVPVAVVARGPAALEPENGLAGESGTDQDEEQPRRKVIFDG